MSKMEREKELGLNEELPIDVMPASNGEFLPEEPSRDQLSIMALANDETERTRRKFGMNRRDFVRTSAAMAIGIWSIDAVTAKGWGRYAMADHDKTNAACDLEHPNAQLNNLPGEFIFDVQSHHVDSDGAWRANNPRLHAFMAGIWTQSGPLGGRPGVREDGSIRGWGDGTELDPVENLSRYHYFKELYLDSSTNMTVLSAVPAQVPDQNCLDIDEAAKTVGMVNALAQNTPRAVMHAFCMPNRGSMGTRSGNTVRPAFLSEELEMMEDTVQKYPGFLRGWKVYCPFGDVSNASGWYLDDEFAYEWIEHIKYLGDKYNVPKTIASHKGFALPGFDQRSAHCRDVGVAAKDHPEVNFVIYHSGYDGEDMGPYAGDENVPDPGPVTAERGVDTLIKSLRVNGVDAESHIPEGLEHGNSPNVWAEIGSVWRSVMQNADEAAHLLGKLVKYVGPRRVCWGTDALWYGSPQPEIVALRALQFSDQAKEFYNLPYGLDGDRFDPRRNAFDANEYWGHPDVADWPTDGIAHPERSIRNGIFGRNVAEPYWVDPDAARALIDCDDVQKIRDAYLINEGTPDPRNGAPLRSNQIIGHRTADAVLQELFTTPWSP